MTLLFARDEFFVFDKALFLCEDKDQNDEKSTRRDQK
jgi:hypothetical protein